MTTQVLGHTRFQQSGCGWRLPTPATGGFETSQQGVEISATPDKTLTLNGQGVHTRNGDSIELRFRRLTGGGSLSFGFDAEAEHARAELDFAADTVSFATL